MVLGEIPWKNRKTKQNIKLLSYRVYSSNQPSNKTQIVTPENTWTWHDFIYMKHKYVLFSFSLKFPDLSWHVSWFGL